MLAIVFLYFIGRYFYELAHAHNKNKWGFAILGVATYFLGTMLFGFFVGLSHALWATTTFSDESGYLIEFVAMPFGFLACWGLYRLLKSRWTKGAASANNDVLDDQFN